MTGKDSRTGGCLCGALRYRVAGPPVWTAVCYCVSCTRAAGAPAVAWAGFPSASFAVLAGRLTVYRSSPGVLRGFCGRCGTSLTYRKDPAVLAGAQDDVYVSINTLDDPDACPPEEHIKYGERAAWFHAGGDLPRHDVLSPAHAHRQLATMTARE
jgi:hypothetical protein